MSRPALASVCALTLSLLVASPTYARSHVIFQQTSRQPYSQITVMRPLSPGHTYRLDMLATGHKPFSAVGTEFYTGIANHQLFTGHQPLNLQGQTPHSTSLSQPSSRSLGQWIISLTVRLTAGRGLTVRIVDLGKHK